MCELMCDVYGISVAFRTSLQKENTKNTKNVSPKILVLLITSVIHHL